MRQRGKQRQRQRLKRRSDANVVSLDPFRRQRFEQEFSKAMFAYKDQVLNEETMKRMRKKVRKIFRRYARSAKLAASIVITTRVKPGDRHTVQILYERDGHQITPHKLYDALCPQAKPVIGWRMMPDGSRVPISNIDDLAELERRLGEVTEEETQEASCGSSPQPDSSPS